jgi:hypothetical protein
MNLPSTKRNPRTSGTPTTQTVNSTVRVSRRNSCRSSVICARPRCAQPQEDKKSLSGPEIYFVKLEQDIHERRPTFPRSPLRFLKGMTKGPLVLCFSDTGPSLHVEKIQFNPKTFRGARTHAITSSQYAARESADLTATARVRLTRGSEVNRCADGAGRLLVRYASKRWLSAEVRP